MTEAIRRVLSSRQGAFLGSRSRLAAVMALALIGCQNPAASTPASSSTSPVLYAANEGSTGSDGISAYTIGTGGALTAITSGTFETGSGPLAIAISPNGEYLYVVNNNDTTDTGGISGYTIGQGGALTAIALGTLTTGDEPDGIAISPNGEYLYVTNQGSSTGENGISGYTIGQGGALTAITSGTTMTGDSPIEIAISPNGDHRYATNSSSTGANGISGYTIGTGGALTAISSGTTTTAGIPADLAFSPNGDYLYVTISSGTTSTDGISAYTIGTGGALTAITAGTFTAGDGPTGIAISPNGDYLYVTNHGQDTISGFTIGSGGTLTAFSSEPLTTGEVPEFIAISPNGDYLYVSNHEAADGADGISAYSIGAGGALSAIGTFTTGLDSDDVAIVVP